jgi:regulator of replication initiation timing
MTNGPRYHEQRNGDHKKTLDLLKTLDEIQTDVIRKDETLQALQEENNRRRAEEEHITNRLKEITAQRDVLQRELDVTTTNLGERNALFEQQEGRLSALADAFNEGHVVPSVVAEDLRRRSFMYVFPVVFAHFRTEYLMRTALIRMRDDEPTRSNPEILDRLQPFLSGLLEGEIPLDAATVAVRFWTIMAGGGSPRSAASEGTVQGTP